MKTYTDKRDSLYQKLISGFITGLFFSLSISLVELIINYIFGSFLKTYHFEPGMVKDFYVFQIVFFTLAGCLINPLFHSIAKFFRSSKDNYNITRLVRILALLTVMLYGRSRFFPIFPQTGNNLKVFAEVAGFALFGICLTCFYQILNFLFLKRHRHEKRKYIAANFSTIFFLLVLLFTWLKLFSLVLYHQLFSAKVLFLSGTFAICVLLWVLAFAVILGINSFREEEKITLPFKYTLIPVAIVIFILFSFLNLQKDNSPDNMKSIQTNNIILLLIDTLRTDHLGSYNKNADHSPNIDRLGAEGVIFKNCISQAPWTVPSFASILTSLYPTQHGSGINTGKKNLKTSRVSDNIKLLTEIMQEADYRTISLLSNPYLHPRLNLTHGFDEYINFDPVQHSRFCRILSDLNIMKGLKGGLPYVPANRMLKKAEEWLKENKNRNFFLLLHFMDPHHPYNPPDRFVSPLRNRKYSIEREIL